MTVVKVYGANTNNDTVRVVIPAPLARQMKIKKGDRVEWRSDSNPVEDRLILVRIPGDSEDI